MEEQTIAGFLLIDKPNGMTSYSCIDMLKPYLPRKIKIGHAGTLDSFATGLLILAIDRTATRNIQDIMKLDKVYIAQGKLGQKTDTLDYTGILLEEKGANGITEQMLHDAITAFGSSYVQVPPVYSALKHEGRKLSTLMRKQKMPKEKIKKIAQEKARKIHLYKLELLSFKPPYFTIKAHVSHGSYIRVLINDIAQKVGSVATTHELCRTNIGPFSVERAISLYDINSLEGIKKHLIPIDQILAKVNKYKKP